VPTPTLPIGLARVIGRLGWGLDDFEFLEEARRRALFRSAAHRVFVRHDSPGREPRAFAEIEFARWAASTGLPVVAPDERLVSQPIVGEFGAVSFWPLLEPVFLGDVDPLWFGRTLRRRLGRAAVRFEVASFEDFVAPEASFDLVVSATAFHWVDPEVKFGKPARLLRRRAAGSRSWPLERGTTIRSARPCWTCG
jgi:hypothetical protein